MSEGGEIRYGEAVIRYSVTRSARRKKTIGIKVDATGLVIVAAPLFASKEQLRDVVIRRAGWILQRAREGGHEPPGKNFISGETLPYLGRAVPLVVTHADVAGVRLRFTPRAFAVTAPGHLQEDERRSAIRLAFLAWYRRRAAERVRASVEQWSSVTGARPNRVMIVDQRRRWGSCAPDGTLRFNWRIAMAHPALLEYVVVHELTHLEHPNHSGAYWTAVERVMPDYRLRRQQIKEVGPSLSI
jgi:hypothetical protein